MREIRMPSLSAARAASLCLMAALAGLAWWVGADGALPGRHARRPRRGAAKRRNRPPRGWRPAPRGWM